MSIASTEPQTADTEIAQGIAFESDGQESANSDSLANAAQVGEEPNILVQGAVLESLPADLYIPPEALRIFLEAFQGPLDLLLYLIKHQNIDILDIPMVQITTQYVAYIEMMKVMELELAADYLLMAATLAEIKSRMLLPKPPGEEGEEEADPRAELIRRLLEYERFKTAAQDLDSLPRLNRDVFPVSADAPEMSPMDLQPDVDLEQLMHAFTQVLKRSSDMASHTITKEPLSIRERMTTVLMRLTNTESIDFPDLFDFSEGRMGVVVTFIAILELLKQMMIQVVQVEPYSVIHVKGVV